MSKTINQYLLDLFTTAQLNAAQKTKDQKQIAVAEKKYKDLDESEVTFGPFNRDLKTGKYTVKVSAKARGNWVNNIAFNTGTIDALSRATQQGAEQISALDLVSIPTLLYVEENKSRYLVVEKDTNISEGLKLTGYSFPEDSFVPTIYGKPKSDSKAVGHVDIDHPIVAGRFLIAYLGKGKEESPNPSESIDRKDSKVDLKSEGNTQVTSENTPASNEGDQANPGSTQGELKTPAQPGQSDNGPTGQSNSADSTQNPVDVAKENEQEAKENEAEQKEQLSSDKDSK